MKAQIEEIRDKIVPVLKRHGVKKAGLFGSVVRDDFTDKSDVDVLVDYPEGRSLFDYIGLKLELEELLDRSVDVVHYDRIRERIRQSIMQDEVRIYDQA